MRRIDIVMRVLVVTVLTVLGLLGFQIIVKELTEPESNRWEKDGDPQPDRPPRRNGDRVLRHQGRRSDAGPWPGG